MKISEFKIIAECYKIVGEKIEEMENQIKYNDEQIKQLEEDISNAENPSHWALEDLQHRNERNEAYKKVIEYLSKYKS